jgi:hypothetical protein
MLFLTSTSGHIFCSRPACERTHIQHPCHCIAHTKLGHGGLKHVLVEVPSNTTHSATPSPRSLAYDLKHAPGTPAIAMFSISLARMASACRTSRRKCAYCSTPGMPKVLPCMCVCVWGGGVHRCCIGRCSGCCAGHGDRQVTAGTCWGFHRCCIGRCSGCCAGHGDRQVTAGTCVCGVAGCGLVVA